MDVDEMNQAGQCVPSFDEAAVMSFVVSENPCFQMEAYAHTQPHCSPHSDRNTIKCSSCTLNRLSESEMSSIKIRHFGFGGQKRDVLELKSASSSADEVMDKDQCYSCTLCNFLSYSTEHVEVHSQTVHPGEFPPCFVMVSISQSVSARVRLADVLFYSCFLSVRPGKLAPPSASLTPTRCGDVRDFDHCSAAVGMGPQIDGTPFDCLSRGDCCESSNASVSAASLNSEPDASCGSSHASRVSEPEKFFRSDSLQHQFQDVISTLQPKMDSGDFSPMAMSKTGVFADNETLLTDPRCVGVDSPRDWLKNAGRHFHQMGQSYVTEKGKEAPAREMGDACFCQAKSTRCREFTHEDRLEVFKYIWTLDEGDRRTFVNSLIQRKSVHRRKKNTDSMLKWRLWTLQFHLPNRRGNVLPVCKKMFVGTTALTQWFIRGCYREPQARRADRNSKKPTAVPPTTTISYNRLQDDKSFLQDEFLNNLSRMQPRPPYQSGTSGKIYLEPRFSSVAKVFKEYQAKCREMNRKSLSRTTFMDYFQKSNLRIFRPQNDL